MINYKVITSLFLFFTGVGSLLAQTAVGNNDGRQTLIDLKDNHGTYVGLQPKSEGVKGTPLLFEDMVKANLHLKNGKQHDNVMVNFYPEKAEVFVQLPNKNVVSPELETIEKVTLDGGNIVYKPRKINGRLEIVRVLYEDEKEEFIVHQFKKFQKATVGGAYNTTSNFDEYKDVIYYYVVNNGNLEEIKQNNAGFKSLAGNDWKTVRSFVKDNNIDWTEPSDALRIYVFAKQELNK